jgi:CheY-like chemotaxis protein
MGGKIWVESELGNGSQFHFTARLGVAAEAPRLVEELPLVGIPVLVVDDNVTNQRILAEMFWNWKMDPTTAASAQEALSHMQRMAARGCPFALVVADVHMPGMDGFDLAARVKDTPGLADAVIMMLTPGEKGGDLERCREMGVAGYLVKPVRKAELRAAIVNALRERPLSRHGSTREAPRSHILVAENDVGNQRVASRILEKAGHSVVIVETGTEALAMLKRHTFDLVLMDIQMPEMDGFEAAAAIRKSESGHIPIIAITALAMPGDRERCLAAGMDDYISKPIRAFDLLRVVEKAQLAMKI